MDHTKFGFTAAELHTFREQYDLLDVDGDDFLSAKDIKKFMASAGKPCRISECKIMIKEIDLLGKGFATFDDFLVLISRVKTGELTNWSMALLYSKPFSKTKSTVFDSVTLHTAEFFGVNDPMEQESEARGFSFFDRIDHKPRESKKKEKKEKKENKKQEKEKGKTTLDAQTLEELVRETTPQDLEAQTSTKPVHPLRKAVHRVSEFTTKGLKKDRKGENEEDEIRSNITVISKNKKRHLKTPEDVASIRVGKNNDGGAESDSSFEFFSDSDGEEESPAHDSVPVEAPKKKKVTHPLTEMNQKGKRVKKSKHRKRKHPKHQDEAQDTTKQPLEGRASAESSSSSIRDTMFEESGELITHEEEQPEDGEVRRKKSGPKKSHHHHHHRHHQHKSSRKPAEARYVVADMPLHLMPSISEDDFDFDITSEVECEDFPQRRQRKGRSEKRLSPTNSIVYLQDPKVRKFLNRGESRPYFMGLLIFAQFAVLAVAVIREQGIEELFINPFVGPSAINLIRVGARFVPCMKEPTPTVLEYFNVTSTTDPFPCPPYYTDLSGAEATSCTFQDVMQFYCGISEFPGGIPNQSWRFLLSILVHMGAIDWALVFLFQVRIGVNIEREIGTLRTVIIYIISGTLGAIFGAIMSPLGVSGGGSGALMGLFALLFIDIFQNWPILVNPKRNLAVLLVCMLVVFGIGLLPLIDNFSHVGGFIGGLLSGFIFLPTVTFGKRDARKKVALAVISALVLAGLFASSLTLFFLGVDGKECLACQSFECFPQDSAWCRVI